MTSLKKYDVIQLVAVVKSLFKITVSLKSQIIKNIKNTVAKILTLLTEIFYLSLSPTAPRFFRFPFRLLFQHQESSGIYQSISILSRSQKRYPSLTFRQVKTWLQSKNTYNLHKPVRYNFPRNRVIVTRTDDQWQADLVDISSLERFNNGYKFLLTCIDVLSKFAWVVPLKNKTGESLVNDFQLILDTTRSPEKLKTDKGTEFLNRNFQSFLKKIASISSPQTVN